MYLTSNRVATMSFLSVMYLAQGLPWGFVSVALTGYMYEQGMSTGEVGTLLAMAMWPWPFKWALGPIVDRWTILSMGRRRPWIIFAQGCMVISTLTILSVPDITSEIRLLGLVLMLHNCFVALQDVGVDALAVDILKDGEREKANAVMFASSHIGTFVGSAGLGYLIGAYNLHVGLWVLAGMQIAIMLFPILLRERSGEKFMPWTKGQARAEVLARENVDIFQLARRVARAFSLRTTILGVVLAVTVMIGMMMTSLIFQRFVIQDVNPRIFSFEGDEEVMASLDRGEIPQAVYEGFDAAGYAIGGVADTEKEGPFILRLFSRDDVERTRAGVQPDPGTELQVEGQGKWVLDRNTGYVNFTPEEEFTGNPAPVSLLVEIEEDDSERTAWLTVVYSEEELEFEEGRNGIVVEGGFEDETGLWRRLFGMSPARGNVPRPVEFDLLRLLQEKWEGEQVGGEPLAGLLTPESFQLVGVDLPGEWVVRRGKAVPAGDPAEWSIVFGNTRYLVREAEPEWTVHRGWTQARYSIYSGTTVLTAVLAALFGGILGSRFGVRRIAAIGTVLLGGTWMVFAFILAPEVNDSIVVLFMHVDQFFTGLLTVALWAMFMQISWPVVAATQFTAYMALLNVSRIIGSQFAGASENYMESADWAIQASARLQIESVPLLLLVAGVIQIGIIFIIFLIDPTQTRRVLGGINGNGSGEIEGSGSKKK